MPRQAGLDAPGILHHVMARGIEQCSIFRGNHDREDFIRRISELSLKKSWIVYAWALMPNHFQLLILTGKNPLSHIGHFSDFILILLSHEQCFKISWSYDLNVLTAFYLQQIRVSRHKIICLCCHRTGNKAETLGSALET
jgi:hypothetical protein